MILVNETLDLGPFLTLFTGREQDFLHKPVYKKVVNIVT